MPVATAVHRHFDPRNSAVIGNGIALNPHRPGGQPLARTGRADRGVKRHGIDRQTLAPVDGVARHIGGKQLVVVRLDRCVGRRVAHLDPCQPFGAAHACIARHHHAERGAVFGRQRLAVHRPGNEDVGLPRLVHGDRDPEQGFLALHVHLVGAGERHEQVGRIRRAHRIENIGQAYAGPLSIADRADIPRIARRLADLLEVRAPVTRALEHGCHRVRGKRSFKFFHREGAARHARPAHLDPMIGGQIRHWPVAAHVEQRLRRQEPLDQRTGRRLGVVGIGTALDHICHGRLNVAGPRNASSLRDHRRRKAADHSDIQIRMTISNGWSYRSGCAIQAA